MEEKKVQLYPSKIRIVPNCKLAKNTSNLDNQSYNNILNGGKGGIIEKKKHKKHGQIISTYTITNADGYDNTDPLTFFDYSVLSVCISEIEEGNTCTTPAIILRGLTGKRVGEVGGTANGTVNPDQRNAIINSVTKMMGTVITINNSAVNWATTKAGKKLLPILSYLAALLLQKSTDKSLTT